VGAAAAIAVYVFLHAEILDFKPSIPMSPVLAFVAGFTEQFVFRIVNGVTGESKNKDK